MQGPLKIMFGVGADDTLTRWRVMCRVDDHQTAGPEEYATQAEALRAASDVSVLAQWIVLHVMDGAALFMPIERDNGEN